MDEITITISGSKVIVDFDRWKAQVEFMEKCHAQLFSRLFYTRSKK